MPRYYCDYCDTYLTHDSPSVRKQHNQGYKHKANVRIYYQQFEEQQTQILIDQRIKEHLGKASVYPQVGSAYNQHLGSFPGQRPPLPLLPTPNAQMPSNLPLFMGVRPPVLPRPVPGAPGYMSAPFNSPMFGAPSLPGQENGPPRPPMLATMSGNTGPPASSATPSIVPPPMYQSNPAQAAPTSGSYEQQHQT